MKIALVTGSAGLIGAESVRFFSKKGFEIIGIDNDMRRLFFGDEASTEWSRRKLESEIKNYTHYSEDIRDRASMEDIFKKYGEDIKVIIHTAAQPSHDWAAKDPFTDFTVNANGTLNLLEMTRQYCPDAAFIFTSTNKVYGDSPNSLPLVELETRWEIDKSHPYYQNGIDESMSVDQTKHSLFGASKLAADALVQEYGKYFNMKTVCFRGGCLTGPGHSSTELHGFLAYLMKCAVTGRHYTIFGYRGKQVRDNIHSYDLVNAFWHFYQKPRIGEVYNIGGGRHSNCSIQEAIEMCEDITGKKMNYLYTESNRIGDHIWWISDVSKFKLHYPAWKYKYSIKEILVEIFQSGVFNVK
ncbi:nucleoside-diphosphate-sugar epimerase [Candidatus Methanoperedens nitroreducens]|uniref:Nucleoside-diphosphate-sugar epimerase n=1 Tax=Candidatus Methanoperedens nitratireducens TaxID=1392998 RepID=A0A062V552_9EURY|nr:NAD-dependent epimerase/dehydratase family protein [Candidatus Methanoperedens nitroreducens]KCZ70525.1 nucleoside-diphosphate-sugar epimerase [Candidatus Methanoperedens nitroreducens]MDJ1420377.1 NAD-dependent epimerase/dehydratase family protein [Candidatus Methanoperedens sp.]